MLQIFAIIVVVLLLLIAVPFITFVFYLAPPVPSTSKSRRKVVEYIGCYASSASSVLEIGTGWGGMTRKVARAYPDKKIISYEISLIPYLFSRFMFTINPMNNVELHYGDAFRTIDSGELIPECTIFYLCSGLEQKMASHKGIIISVNFPIKNREPLAREDTGDFANGSVYVYPDL